MISKIYSSLGSFKELELKEGLNILLADKLLSSTERQTRNGAGKSSLIELIHFLTGASANLSNGSIFLNDDLIDESFGMTFEVAGHSIDIVRAGRTASDVSLRFETPSSTQLVSWIPAVTEGSATSEVTVSNTAWTKALGTAMFDLPTRGKDASKDLRPPTFRSIFPYFVRRQSRQAFSEPIKHDKQQQTGDWQTGLTFLLGLDWTIPAQWESVREREKTLRGVRKGARDGAFGDVIGRAADLRTELALSEERLGALKRRLNAFAVLPQYHELESEASRISRVLNDITTANAIDLEHIDQLRSALSEEIEPEIPALEEVYREAGVILSQEVLRRFEEVELFHNSVIQNRRSYLMGELEGAQSRVLERDSRRSDVARRYDEIISILSSHGALDQFYQLQSQITRLESTTESLRQRFQTAENLEGLKNEMDIERRQLLRRLQQDYGEQDAKIRRAIIMFEEVSRSLYEEAGQFKITESTNGPEFDFSIHAIKSKGISNMQIFTFDMMLMMSCMDQGKGPRFLVHDSHLFDGVDGRQRAAALKIGAQLSESLGFQYIVTMNSDDFRSLEFFDDFDIDRYVLPVRLTDDLDAGGGLFGIPF